MSAAKKCDRCGILYEEYNTENSSENINGIMTLNIDRYGTYYSHKPLDLCPQCADSLKNWMKY